MHEEAHTDPIPVTADWSLLPFGNSQSHPARRGINAKTFVGALVGITEEIPLFTTETISPRVAEDWSKRIGMTIYWLAGAGEEAAEDTTIDDEVRVSRLAGIDARVVVLKPKAQELHEALKPLMLVDGKFVRRAA